MSDLMTAEIRILLTQLRNLNNEILGGFGSTRAERKTISARIKMLTDNLEKEINAQLWAIKLLGEKK